MKGLALVDSNEAPSVRLRLLPFLPSLAARGLEFEVQPFDRSDLRRWRQIARARDVDVVWWSRRLAPPWESAWLRRCARRLVVDLDDALWRRDQEPHESLLRRWRLRALARRADVVVAGAASLARELATVGVRAEVLVTPHAAPHGDADTRAHSTARSATPTLLWIGQPSTWRYVAPFAAAWSRRPTSHAASRLLVLGAPAGTAAPGLEARPWSREAERAALEEAWVGLAPLPDDPWTRGKCGARLQAYLAAGLHALASPVGAQAELAAQFWGVTPWPAGDDGVALACAALSDPARGGVRQAAVAAALARERSVERLGGALFAFLTGSRTVGGGVAEGGRGS